MNGSHGVLNTWFVADGQPSLQRQLAVITGLAAVNHDRVVVRCAGQGHLKFVHCRVVAGDRGHGKAIARRQFHGQLAEPRSGEVFVIILVTGEVFCRTSSGVPLSICLFKVIMP